MAEWYGFLVNHGAGNQGSNICFTEKMSTSPSVGMPKATGYDPFLYQLTMFILKKGHSMQKALAFLLMVTH
jgi:hypothetical protein